LHRLSTAQFALALMVTAAFGLSLSGGFAFDNYSLFSDPAVTSNFGLVAGMATSSNILGLPLAGSSRR
jgi:hypothetical protein